MKTLFLSAAILLSLPIHAESVMRASLVGKTTTASVLVCKYVAPTAKFEIVSQKNHCAPYIQVR